jgi:CDP-diacylglycerol--serine O-phosphatidyltransferase
MCGAMTAPAAAIRLRNGLTYAGLGLGLAAMAAAGRGHLPAAGALIALAVIADTFDGRFARRFSRHDDGQESAIGAELDSLCDACTFGVAPVVCTLFSATRGATDITGAAAMWIAGSLYVAAAVTRLAFYNATHLTIPGFIGLPVPVAALVWSSVLCMTQQPLALTVVLVTAACAMVAPWRIGRPTGAGLALFVLWPVLVGFLHFAYP